MNANAARFWERTEAELAERPLRLELELDAFYSQPEWNVFRMTYDGAGGHRLFAWLSVPKSRGPFPALLRLPDYASVHDIIYTPLRRRAVVLNATHRGQRHSDGRFRAAYPGLLTEGLDSVDSWMLLGAFADALRAWDALQRQERVELGPAALTGAGLGGALALAVAARRPGLAAVAADTPMPLGHPAALSPGLGYPLGELEDYLRYYPERRAAVAETLSTLTPIADAAAVTAPTLLSAGRFDRSLSPPEFAQELAAALPNGDLRLYDGAAEGGGHRHAVVRGAWLAEKLGLD